MAVIIINDNMIELTNLSITHLTGEKAGKNLCNNVNLRVDNGEFITLMGASGCGKSTLLSSIVGNLAHEFLLSGDIKINQKSVLDLPIEKRCVGIMFQEPLLFPHMNVEQNLLLGMPAHLPKRDKLEQINQFLATASLENINKAHIDTLSGGQASRIALLRTLLSKPSVILLDEPFAKLDENLKQGFRAWVFEIIKSQNIPTIQVTHSVQDALEGEVIQFENLQIK